ncbi:MAG: flagellar biosynthesis protein FlhB [Planctomycetota bacterium]
MADNAEQGEKTEDATPKRLEDAREKGQVAMSNEIVVAAGLLTATLSLTMTGPLLWRQSSDIVRDTMLEIGLVGQLHAESGVFSDLMRNMGTVVLPGMLLFVLPIYALSLLVGYGQIGFRLTPKAITPDWGKLNPAKGIKKVIGAKAWMRTLLSTLKIAAISIAVVSAVYSERLTLGSLVSQDLTSALGRTGDIMLKAALAGIAAAVLLGLIDLAWQRYQHAKELRMTKKEVKDEAKQTEGDPHVKARIRSIQREVARRRMMDDVPKATVVITNPTHFAVALRYEQNGADRAPYVVAKGMDQVALNIRRVATENGVPIVEDPPLARGLHRMVEIGDEIPVELFEAVARVLAFVLNPGSTYEPVGGVL